MNAEQRQRVFDASQAYQQSLQKRGALDWGDVPGLLWQLSENGQVEFPSYDIILVDEAQFFAQLWIKLIQKLPDPRNGHLFLVADPTQGFLGRVLEVAGITGARTYSQSSPQLPHHAREHAICHPIFRKSDV